jgi:hypothetical protein
MPFDIQSLLKDWGVTFASLGFISLGIFIVLTFSFRAFLGWFFRIGEIKKSQKSVLAQLKVIQGLIEDQIPARKIELVKTPTLQEPNHTKVPLGKFPVQDPSLKPPSDFKIDP